MSIAAAEAAKDKGNAAFKSGDLPLALAHYTTAIALDPSAAIYLQNRSLVHLKLKQWQQAEADATKAFKLDPASAKALYRRGLARVGAGGKVELAREDFLEAIKLGGGPEVQAELDKLPKKAAAAAAQATPTSEPTSRAADSAKNDRLKAALAPPTTSTSSAKPSTASQPQPTTAPNTSKPRPPLPPNELMKEVSTRKLTPSSGAAGGGSTFAQKKEQRQSRLGNGISGTKQTPKEATTPASRSQATPISSPTPPPASTSPPPSTQPAPSSVPFEQLSIAEREIALSPAWQSMAETKYTMPITESATQAPAAPSLKKGQGAAPTSWAQFEREWTMGNARPEARESILRSLSPPDLPALFGDALTPDLLSDIVKTLAADPAVEAQRLAEKGWKVELLRGLTKVRRFDVGVMFMDEPDKALLRSVFTRAREALAQLEGQWEL